jgi:Mg-chelatase subunit ChlD
MARWRLVLGAPAASGLGPAGRLDDRDQAADEALEWLYGREAEREHRNVRPSGAGDGHPMTVPEWLAEVHRLFPQEVIERLERDALERYRIASVVTDPVALAAAVPNEALLAAILQAKHLMNPGVLAAARVVVATVVEELRRRLMTDVRVAFSGTADRRRPSALRIARNLDVPKTLRLNLRHYDPVGQRLVLRRAHFFSRVRPHTSRWQVILLVDQSGSMVGNLIHAAVMAACLWQMPALKVHCVLWDTALVDVTPYITDPLETLLSVSLGGGNDAAQALRYAAGLIVDPQKSIVVLITDFYEGHGTDTMLAEVRALCEQGTQVLGLAALDTECRPVYDKPTAEAVVAAGAEVAAMTPAQLASWVAEKVGR